MTWGPCEHSRDPEECCRRKPKGCDMGCRDGKFMGTVKCYRTRQSPPPRNCPATPACQTAADPHACCRSKPDGCDQKCIFGAYWPGITGYCVTAPDKRNLHLMQR